MDRRRPHRRRRLFPAPNRRWKTNCLSRPSPRSMRSPLQRIRPLSTTNALAYGVVRAFMLHFRNVLSSRFIQKRVKLATLIFSSGYIMISLLLLTTIFGMLNMVCGLLGFDPSTAASSTYTVGHFIYDSTLNLILTGGMLISSLAACFINGFGFRNLGRLFFAALTIGFICMFFVGRGIFTAWLGLPMKWFMLKKAGNERAR